MSADDQDEIPEIAVAGDLTDCEADLTRQLLEVPPGGRCVIYFDSPGGSPYSGMSLMSLLLLRGLRATGVVTGECSSAALWPFAACARRLVVPYSVLLFHPMKWQSEEHVGLAEAAEWARHFGQLETDMDHLLADLFGISKAEMDRWMRPGRYVSGREMAENGLAELVELKPLKLFEKDGASQRRKASRAGR
ncbi:MAG TPA: ATP-dependent Clp protease proteolytic subunit [Pirellulales bacterium]|nr:ATP-dependent Clp protease proteolytic subunit [Pirellulales bacterium]